MTDFYNQQLIQLIMEEIRTFRNSLRTKEYDIESKFELVLVSIPKNIRNRIISQMEQPLIELKHNKDVYLRTIKNKSGYTNTDRREHFRILDINTYTPFLSIIIDELDMEFRHQESNKTINPIDMN